MLKDDKSNVAELLANGGYSKAEVDNINQLADQGDSSAMHKMYEIFKNQDKKIAFKYLRMACEKKHPEANIAMGDHILALARDIQKNDIIKLYHDRACKYYLAAAENGNAGGLRGFLWDDFDRNNVQFTQLLILCADKGCAKSQSLIGEGYANTKFAQSEQINLPQDFIKAKEYYDLSCSNDKPFATAFKNLGDLYSSPRKGLESITPDYQKAFSLYKKAIELGENDAYDSLSKLVLRGTDYDYTIASMIWILRGIVANHYSLDDFKKELCALNKNYDWKDPKFTPELIEETLLKEYDLQRNKRLLVKFDETSISQEARNITNQFFLDVYESHKERDNDIAIKAFCNYLTLKIMQPDKDFYIEIFIDILDSNCDVKESRILEYFKGKDEKDVYITEETIKSFVKERVNSLVEAKIIHPDHGRLIIDEFTTHINCHIQIQFKELSKIFQRTNNDTDLNNAIVLEIPEVSIKYKQTEDFRSMLEKNDKDKKDRTITRSFLSL